MCSINIKKEGKLTMIDVSKLMQADRVKVTYREENITGEYVKNFRCKHNLTQMALANTFNVSKKTIEKWEHDKTKAITGSSRVLFTILNENPELLGFLRQIETIKSDADNEYDTFEISNLNYVEDCTSNKASKLNQSKKTIITTTPIRSY